MRKKSTAPRKSTKRPRQDKPPFKHQSGRWAKKCRAQPGNFAYLGSITDDPTGERAQQIWDEQKHRIRAGHKPLIDANDQEGVTVKQLCNSFLAAKEALVSTGELAQRSFDDYFATCVRLADEFGRGRLVDDLRSEDFSKLRTKLGRRWSPVTLSNEINRIRVLFKWGFDSELMDRPVRFGTGFQRPSQKTMRIARIEAGPKFFEASAIRQMLEAADPQLKAMILLGVNCGFGNADCARLRLEHLDLKSAYADFPRPKTGMPRRCPLWPETVKAIMAAGKVRPKAKSADDEPLLFITKYGHPWRKESTRDNPLSHKFGKLCDSLDIPRNGGFYSLRHVVETVGGEVRDQPALDLIMGHAPKADDMASRYREHIGDDRLVAISNHVRKWLWPKPKPGRRG